MFDPSFERTKHQSEKKFLLFSLGILFIYQKKNNIINDNHPFISEFISKMQKEYSLK